MKLILTVIVLCLLVTSGSEAGMSRENDLVIRAPPLPARPRPPRDGDLVIRTPPLSARPRPPRDGNLFIRAPPGPPEAQLKDDLVIRAPPTGGRPPIKRSM